MGPGSSLYAEVVNLPRGTLGLRVLGNGQSWPQYPPSSTVGAVGVEGEESNLPCGTLSLFDRSFVASPVAHVDQQSTRTSTAPLLPPRTS